MASFEVGSAAGGEDDGFVHAHHGRFIRHLAKKSTQTERFEFAVTEYMRMSGIYWGLTAMALMGRDLRAEMGTDELIEWVLSCQHDSGGFGGAPGHDPHLLYTTSAVQILAICDALPRCDTDAIARFVGARQQPDGSFHGDEWGEIDTRFSYCALLTLAIIGRLSSPSSASAGGTGGGVHSDDIDVAAACDWVIACQNFDGGFGCAAGTESHAGQVSELL